MGWTNAINAKVCATKLRRNFSQRAHKIHPIGPWPHVLVRFIVFWCIWDHFVTAWNSVQNRMNWCNYSKSLCHEVAAKIFATSTPDPTHRTLNSSFGAFHRVQVHLGLFCSSSKLGAKRAELVQLMQNVMPRSRVIIFHNKRTRSTPLDRNLMFWCVS